MSTQPEAKSAVHAARRYAGLRLQRLFRGNWTSSEFDTEALSLFAQPVMRAEARDGIFALGVLSMLLMAGLSALYFELDQGAAHLYTFGVLGLLALHVALSAKLLGKTAETKVFYLLGIALLAFAALAFVLLAHRASVFSAALFSSVALLFMVVPLVPWGLREALLASGTVYLIFTGSTLGVASRFEPRTLWTLQFLMLSAAIIALALVWRSTVVRRGHLQARFSLTQSNEKLAHTALQDSLTSAWNRRFLDERYAAIAAGYAARAQGYCVALVDVDKFKQLNDNFGHIYGDRVLQRLVKVLEHALGSDEYVIRIGGDEFVLLLRGEDALQRLARTCEEMERRKNDRLDALQMPRVSIGVVRVRPGRQIAYAQAYASADKAMYAVKGDPSRSVAEVLADDSDDAEGA